MGKRKSKSGKQKQKQTKKKSGNSILGKNGSKRKFDINGGSKSNSSSSHGDKDIRLLCSLPKPKPSTATTTTSTAMNTNTNTLPQVYGQQHFNTRNEREEFERQMNSLVERTHAKEASMRNRTTGRKLGRRRRQLRTTPTTSNNTNPILSMMKPASFSLVKSTHQLMEETMHQMGQIMSNGNNSNNHSNIHSNHNNHGGSSLARAVAYLTPSERTPIASNVQHTNRMSMGSGNLSAIPGIATIGTGTGATAGRLPARKNHNARGNSFAALGHGDSSEDEDENSKDDPEIVRANPTAAAAAPSIRFAAASFSLGNGDGGSQNRFLPTKTPPTTPSSTPNHHYLATRASGVGVGHKVSTLFGSSIQEEEIEELHYQQQTRGQPYNRDYSHHHRHETQKGNDDDDDL